MSLAFVANNKYSVPSVFGILEENGQVIQHDIRKREESQRKREGLRRRKAE